jgi:hypothetical protein
VAIQKRVPHALTWSDLTDFSATCDPSTWRTQPGPWLAWSPISLPLNRTLYAYAVDVVGSAESSEVVRHDYRQPPYAESSS